MLKRVLYRNEEVVMPMQFVDVVEAQKTEEGTKNVVPVGVRMYLYVDSEGIFKTSYEMERRDAWENQIR